jgi:hypothetical protein
MNLRILFVILLACSLSCCENEYEPFDASPTAKVGVPKIRVLNLSTKHSVVTVSFGEQIFATQLTLRKLTGYVNATPEILQDSIVTVRDEGGNLLVSEKLTIQIGSNYTIIISPEYERVASTFLAESSRPRSILKIKDTNTRVALIRDLATSPFPDRTAIRWVTVAADEAASGSPNVSTYPIAPAIDSANYTPLLGEQLYTGELNVLNATPFELPISFRDANYDAANPPYYQNSGYQVRSPQSVYFYAGLPDINFVNGFPINKASFPFQLEGGKSYTILTNGTFGQVNDASRATSEKAAIPLEPIPYELYVIEDSDGAERMLTPVELYAPSNYYAFITVCGFHEEWATRNPGLELNLITNGTRPFAKTHDANRFQRFSINTFGNLSVQLTPSGATRPVLGVSQATLKRGGEYVAFYYKDVEGKNQFQLVDLQTPPVVDVLRVRVAHFSPDLGEIDLIDKENSEVLVSKIGYSTLTGYIDLKVERSGNEEDIRKLSVVKHGTKEELFPIDFVPNGFLINRGGKNMAHIGTLFLSGRFYATELYPFSKMILIGKVSGVPSTTADEATDLVYELIEM